jgi:hypothetical protein
MQLFDRVIYSFCGVVFTTGLFIVLDIVFRFEIGELIFSAWFAVPTFVIFYLIAPHASKNLPLE